MLTARWWDLAAIVVASVIVVLTLIDPPYGADEVGAWAAAGAFLVVYFAYGRRHVDGATVQHHLVIALLFAAVLAVGTAFEPAFAILQAFLYPFVWTTAPNLRSALVANIAIAVAIVVGYTARLGPAGILTGVGIAVLSVGGSIALGLWITRIAAYGEERARLLDELQAAQGQLAAMHREAGVTDERGRLAREIHDTIAQSLTGLVMVAQRAGNRLDGVDGVDGDTAASVRGDIELMEQMGREALTEARGLVASLTPVEADAGLAEALRRLATSFERETGVAVTVTADAAGLDRELEVVLLRCAQEALANVRKHAKARTATIDVDGDRRGRRGRAHRRRRRRRARRRGARRAGVRTRRDPRPRRPRRRLVRVRPRLRRRRAAAGRRAADEHERRGRDERAIRIVVADDHPIVRAGIVGLLDQAPGIEVVGEASDGAEAVELAASERPDLVLMDLRMPGVDGASATASIVAAGQGTRVLVLTTYETDDHILAAIEAGASGYLLKAAPQAEILAGIRAVAAGETVLAPSIAAKLVSRVRADAASVAPPALSPREREVLALVAAGRSNPEIARDLYIGEATVKTHLLHAFEKLGVNDRTRAVTRAMELGLL